MKIGSYEIQKQLGEGSFGRTFLAEHQFIKGLKACIKQEKTGQKPYTELFKEEAHIVSRLRHPSLPSFLDYMELGGDIGQVLVLSYIDGEALDKLVLGSDDKNPKSDFIDDEHICWIIDRILGALGYLHGRWNIVHCDLKPGNVIIDLKDHNATVVDLGMAYFKPDDISKAKGGTPGYFPPEFGAGLPPIPASDIFSVGKIALFMSGGDVLRGEFPASMNKELVQFFSPMIIHDPRERPQNVDKVRHDLGVLRKKIFGRSSCREMFKFRDGKVVSK